VIVRIDERPRIRNATAGPVLGCRVSFISRGLMRPRPVLQVSSPEGPGLARVLVLTTRKRRSAAGVGLLRGVKSERLMHPAPGACSALKSQRPGLCLPAAEVLLWPSSRHQRMLLFCVGRGTDWRRAGLPGEIVTTLIMRGLIVRDG
jgi:hypothetical protein